MSEIQARKKKVVDFEEHAVRIFWELGLSLEDAQRHVARAHLTFSNKVLGHAQSLGHTEPGGRCQQ